MSNTKACNECGLYHAIIKPHRKGGVAKNTGRGHCLDRTIYAENRVGNPVYPPRAKVKELPFGQHMIALQRETDVVEHCVAFKPKGK